MSAILIADIGGTNARFAIVEGGEIHVETYLKVADFPGRSKPRGTISRAAASRLRAPPLRSRVR